VGDSALEERIGYRFRDPELLEEALRHGSAPARSDGKPSYERLEFLGDAVLNLCIAHEIFRLLPVAGEGVLTRVRAAVINNGNLVRVGERIGVPAALVIAPSVRRRGAAGITRKMVADAVEAIVGAIFVDAGYDAALGFVRERFGAGEWMDTLVGGFDAKSRLQEWCQREGVALPVYTLLSTTGPPHARVFRAEVQVRGRARAEGAGRSKKEAETAAAVCALSTLDTDGEPAP
jgi:ribonuclease III